jgi:hypothetical protein
MMQFYYYSCRGKSSILTELNLLNIHYPDAVQGPLCLSDAKLKGVETKNGGNT